MIVYEIASVNSQKQKFSECSGLKVNEEENEFFSLGTRNSEHERLPHEFKTSIKILGVHLSFDYRLKTFLFNLKASQSCFFV